MSQKLKERSVFDIADRNIENLFWISKFVSGTPGPTGVYASEAIKESDLPNFANYPTTFAENVQHDQNGNELAFINGKRFLYSQAVAPTMGDAEMEHYGYGSLLANILKRTYNGSFQEIESLFGDGSSEHLRGFHSFGDSINPGAKLQAVTNSSGVVAIRGYHYGLGGRAGDFIADGTNAQALRANAIGFGASGLKSTGYYSLDIDGRILTANIPVSVGSVGSKELFTLDNMDGTSTVMMKN